MPAASAEDVARDVGRKLAEMRADKGLTQQDLAARVQTTVQWISRVENGSENLTLASLVKLANALEVSVGDLFARPTNRRKVGPGRPRKL